MQPHWAAMENEIVAQRTITDAELRSLAALLEVLMQDSQLMAGLSILERQEIERTCETVRSLFGKATTVRERSDSTEPDADTKREHRP